MSGYNKLPTIQLSDKKWADISFSQSAISSLRTLSRISSCNRCCLFHSRVWDQSAYIEPKQIAWKYKMAEHHTKQPDRKSRSSLERWLREAAFQLDISQSSVPSWSCSLTLKQDKQLIICHHGLANDWNNENTRPRSLSHWWIFSTFIAFEICLYFVEVNYCC